ncbi:hypothetical protein Droror1_Dr00004398 [Drosera rotundifolia]
MGIAEDKLRDFINNRWLVLVASMWIQSCAGIGYLFGIISPVIKSAMGYNQRQIALLGVAKDLGDSIGFIAGSLCEVLPIWGILCIGVVQNFLGYGLVWLIVTNRLPSLPLWVLCVAIFVGTNGETYFNTAALVACVQNFPKSRGPVVGILKGFAGLSGAILSEVYSIFNSSSDDSLILLIAVGPPVVILSLMFIVRPVGGHRQIRPSDGLSFSFIYGVCLLLAVYLLGTLILEDLEDLAYSLITLFSVILLVILVLPVIIPIILVFISEPRTVVEVNLLPEPQVQVESQSDEPEVILSEVESEAEEERAAQGESLGPSERRKRIAQLQAKLLGAAAVGAVRVKRRKGPRRGENFTVKQTLVKADFWLMFFSLVLAAGSGITVIDNMGQICESLGYDDTRIFVSLISIWNFLGRVGGGYFSEVIVKTYAFPRPVAMAVVQVIMAIGLLYYAMAWPGAIYVVIVLVGLGYGAHWAIVPATVSELFGLKSFGALYNFLTLAMPVGSLIFSGVIASGIYDYEADKQAALQRQNLDILIQTSLDGTKSLSCTGTICYSTTCGILSGLCLVAVALTSIVVHRTRSVYSHLYVKLPS